LLSRPGETGLRAAGVDVTSGPIQVCLTGLALLKRGVPP